MKKNNWNRLFFFFEMTYGKPKHPTLILLEVINELSKVAWHKIKIKIQKLVAFLYTNNKLPEIVPLSHEAFDYSLPSKIVIFIFLIILLLYIIFLIFYVKYIYMFNYFYYFITVYYYIFLHVLSNLLLSWLLKYDFFQFSLIHPQHIVLPDTQWALSKWRTCVKRGD